MGMRVGAKHSKETRLKMSKARSGVNHHFYGKKHSVETKNKIAKALKGTHLSEETKAKIRESCRRENLSKETRERMSIANSGERNGFYGKRHSEETKRRISKKRMGTILSEEHKMKIAKGNTDKPPKDKPKYSMYLLTDFEEDDEEVQLRHLMDEMILLTECKDQDIEVGTLINDEGAKKLMGKVTFNK